MFRGGPLVKPLIVLAGLMALLSLFACTREVIKEVEREVPVDRVVEKEVPVEKIVEKEIRVEVPKEVVKEVIREVAVQPTTPPSRPSASGSTGPQVYQLGIFEDLTTTNYWSYLGPDTTIWNSYVLAGGKPALYGLSVQRFDWIPSAAADFPTELAEETVGDHDSLGHGSQPETGNHVERRQ